MRAHKFCLHNRKRVAGGDTTCRTTSPHLVACSNVLKRVQDMFWLVISLAALAYTFVKIGALSVLTKVLTLALLGALLVIIALIIAMLWQTLSSGRAR